jgi:hypothetical protein
MSDFGDDEGEMTAYPRLDDATVEALISGRPVPAELDGLTTFVAEMRSMADGPVEPSARLASMMASGVFTDRSDLSPTAGRNDTGSALLGSGLPMWRRLRVAAGQVLAAVAAKLAGMGVAAKGVAVATVAVAAVGTAGAAGALPDSVQDTFDRVVTNETPDEQPTHPENFGGMVSEDARDGGVDGGEISELAKLNGNRPDHAGKPTDVPKGPPSHAGKPTDVPKGPPSHAGKPSDVPPSHAGKPSDVPTGPPSHAGRPTPTPAPTP